MGSRYRDEPGGGFLMRETGLFYTLTGPTGLTAALNPANFQTPGLFVKSIKFAPTVRASMADRPQAHGTYLDNAYKTGMAGTIEVRNVGNASQRQSQSDNYMALLDSMLGEDGTGTLSWTPMDGSATRQISGLQVVGDFPTTDEAGALKSIAAIFRASKPYAESATATTVDSSALSIGGTGVTFTAGAGGGALGAGVTFTSPSIVGGIGAGVTFAASSGGIVTVSNTGSTKVAPIIRLYGSISAPSLVNVTTGKRLVFTSSITAPDYWEIDLFNQTVTLNGTTNIIGNLDPSQSDWFRLGVGSTQLQVTGGSADASSLLRVLMRSAWS